MLLTSGVRGLADAPAAGRAFAGASVDATGRVRTYMRKGKAPEGAFPLSLIFAYEAV